MDQKLVSRISKKVYSQFPELKGSKPKIAHSKTRSSRNENFVLTYSIMSKGIRGKAIPRHVRVVADASGKIVKMSTSR